jgi:putative ATPase
VQRRALNYDRDGDQHYDTISAFIKSMRGSDPDAALYWLARMVYAGEDPRFIARRIVICAAEDVGNADPRALTVAMAAADAVAFIGWPEGRIPLAQAALYVASAPKSNAAYLGIDAALEDVAKETGTQVPVHLRSSTYPEADKRPEGWTPPGETQGAGQVEDSVEGPRRVEYIYPHDCPGHHVVQQYLPEGRSRGCYYRPSEMGYEGTIRERLGRLWPEYSKPEYGKQGRDLKAGGMTGAGLRGAGSKPET